MHALIFVSLCLGIVTGLRAFTPAAALCWAAHLGYLPLTDTKLAWIGSIWCVAIFTLLAIFELINDQNPKTPSRLVPPQFGARILFGALCGALVGFHFHSILIGTICGIVGAVLGTLGGAKARGGLAKLFGRDLPAGLLEDAIAVFCAAMLVTHHL